MAIDTFAEHGEPEPSRDDSMLEAQANAALERWPRDHSEVEADIRDTARVHIHYEELQGRTREADKAVQDAEHRHATLATRLDPGGHRILGFAAGRLWSSSSSCWMPSRLTGPRRRSASTRPGPGS